MRFGGNAAGRRGHHEAGGAEGDVLNLIDVAFFVAIACLVLAVRAGVIIKLPGTAPVTNPHRRQIETGVAVVVPEALVEAKGIDARRQRVVNDADILRGRERPRLLVMQFTVDGARGDVFHVVDDHPAGDRLTGHERSALFTPTRAAAGRFVRRLEPLPLPLPEPLPPPLETIGIPVTTSLETRRGGGPQAVPGRFIMDIGLVQLIGSGMLFVDHLDVFVGIVRVLAGAVLKGLRGRDRGVVGLPHEIKQDV